MSMGATRIKLMLIIAMVALFFDPAFAWGGTDTCSWYWSDCTKSCGGGTQYVLKTESEEACGFCNIPSGLRECNSNCCPVDCVLSPWTPWTDCSHTCGAEGTKTRLRDILQDGDCGATCDTNLFEIEECNRSCFNGGIATSTTCVCTGGWKGDCCQEACSAGTVDLLFLLDGSGSVEGHFEQVKEWVKNVSKPLASQMELGYVDIGVVQYSHYYAGLSWDQQKYITTEIKIGEFDSFEDFSKAVDGIVHQRFTTYTGRALEKVMGDFNTSSRFNMTNNKQVLFLVTDGKSSDPENILKNAEALREVGVSTYAVGVGDTDRRELELIATGKKNSPERVYQVESFDQLISLVDQLQMEILAIPESC